MKIDSEFDDLNILFDVQGTDSAADIVDESHAARAEAVIVILQLDRPIAPESPFDAGARGPAESRFQSFKVVSGECIECAVAVARPGGAAFAVKTTNCSMRSPRVR